MQPTALRPLLVLIAVLGALTAPGAAAARADVVQHHVETTACAMDRFDIARDAGRPRLAVTGEPAPVSLADTEEPGTESCSSEERVDRLPQPEHTVPPVDPRRCGAFAPGESPAALAFLRLNGSANAGGTGT